MLGAGDGGLCRRFYSDRAACAPVTLGCTTWIGLLCYRGLLNGRVVIMIYEVRSERRPFDDDECVPVIAVETRRTDHKVAKEDVALFTMFGVKAWIVEC